MIPNSENNKSIDNELFVNRLELFITQKKMNTAEFERACNLKRNGIDSAIRNKGAIGSDKLSKISTSFPDLNLKWLLTGAGEMVGKEQKNLSITKR